MTPSYGLSLKITLEPLPNTLYLILFSLNISISLISFSTLLGYTISDATPPTLYVVYLDRGMSSI